MCCLLSKIWENPQITPHFGVFLFQKNAYRESLANFEFTGKEQDEETGFYYYGARYLNPKTSMWISADPAMGDYIPKAPVDEEARKHNGNLPGMGGVFNYVNMHVYHYAGNNPVRFIDPNGEYEIDIENGTIKSNLNDINDMKEANRLYLNKFPSFKSIATDDATGISVTFNSPKDMRDFLFNNPDGIDVSALKSLFDNLGTESVIASLAADALNNAGLSRAATGISITALAADINKARKNLNPDTVSDIVIDVIGFKTPEGLLLNAGLTVGKQAGKWYVEKLSESLVGFAYSTFLSDPIFR